MTGPGTGPRPMMPIGMRPPGPGGPMIRPRMPTPNLGAPRPPYIPISTPTPILEKPQESPVI